MPTSPTGSLSRTLAAPLAPRKQALKALGKHTFGALKHSAAYVVHWTHGAASKQIASHSGPESALARAYGLAAKRTRPLAENERATAGAHLLAAGSAAKDLLFKTSTYDASAAAENLAGLKIDNDLRQRLRKLVLEATPKAPASGAETQPGGAAPVIGKDAMTVRTAKRHGSAVRAAAAAVGHAATGTYHKAKEGTHLMGAKLLAGATLITQAHRMAQALHSAKAAVSFADASVQAKHAMHYASISARKQTARAAGALARQSEKFSHTALARSLAGLSGRGKAALNDAVHRHQPRLAQLAHRMLSPHAIAADKPTPHASAATPKPLAPEGEKQ